MTENLKNWIEENNLIVSELGDDSDLDILEIPEVGKFLFIKPFDGKILDEDFAFVLSDEEYDAVEDKKFDYFLFEFGGKFYYSKIKPDRNRYNEVIYKPEFNDFKYLYKTAEEFIMPFVHLGVHDEYEMLNGSGATDLWATKAKFMGHTAIGMCNKNTLASTLSFQSAVEKKGLKSILGETIDVAPYYDPNQSIQETFELKLFVLTEEGWNNLLMINKAINVDYMGFIPEDVLAKHGAGLAAVIPKDSEVNYYKDDKPKVRKILKRYKEIFDELYYQIDTVEYTSPTLFKRHLANLDNYIINLRKHVRPILINDSYYLDSEEKDLKAMLNKVAGKATPEATNQFYKSVGDTLRSYEEWLDDVEPLFQVIVDGIENTVKLSEKVNFRIDNSDRKLPEFEVSDPESLFFEKLQEGIERKLVGKVKNLDEYLDRIETECNLIVPNDLCSYFLILWDIMRWCREEGILTGPGRGSVCGSLVAYCLDITQIDPIPYELYFERFINPTRVSAHYKFDLVLEDGTKISVRDGDKLKLTDGTEIIVNKDTDFSKLDIAV